VEILFLVSAEERFGKLVDFKARKLILMNFYREGCTCSMHKQLGILGRLTAFA
jgi:hypothetical protein